MSTKRVSLLSASMRVFDLSLGEMLWSRRTIFMALVVAGPVLIAVFTRMIDSLMLRPPNAIAGPTIFGLMVWVFYLRFTVPVLGVFYGTSLIADEVEDRTITYLFTRPIPRGAVLLGKYLAYWACTVLVVLPSIVLVYLLITPIRGSLGGSFIPLLKDLGLLALGLGVYGAVFAFLGAQLKRPLLTGLIFVIGWEPTVLLIPGYMKRLTVAYYLQGLVPHSIPQTSPVASFLATFLDIPSLPTSLISLAVIWAVGLSLGMMAVERREYVLEQ